MPKSVHGIQMHGERGPDRKPFPYRIYMKYLGEWISEQVLKLLLTLCAMDSAVIILFSQGFCFCLVNFVTVILP